MSFETWNLAKCAYLVEDSMIDSGEPLTPVIHISLHKVEVYLRKQYDDTAGIRLQPFVIVEADAWKDKES